MKLNFCIIILIFCIIFSNKVKCTYVVGWMANNPKSLESLKMMNTDNQMVPILVAKDNSDDSKHFVEGENNKLPDDQPKLLNDEENLKNYKLDSKDDQFSLKNDLHRIGLTTEDKLKCKKNSDCLSINKEMYCDNHYGFCRESSKEGGLCRIDGHCSDSMICMFGKCQKPKPIGKVGARCFDDSDCDRDHCCAKLLGSKICKPKLKLNQKCFVPFGGLDYSLNEQCPCVEGLSCQATQHDDTTPLRKIIPKNPKIEHLRCSLDLRKR